MNSVKSNAVLSDNDRLSPDISPSLTALHRRDVLKYGGLAALLCGLPSIAKAATVSPVETIAALPHDNQPFSAVINGYQEHVIIRWGDPLQPMQPFSLAEMTPERQLHCVGISCDYTAFFPLPKNSKNSQHGLLTINHEFPNPSLMHADATRPDAAHTRLEQAAVGVSIVEVRRQGQQWQVVTDSPYNRRLTALDTLYHIKGHAAGSKRLQTLQDPTGTRVMGMMGNCAGGVTPWGTLLTCEENISHFFAGHTDIEEQNYQRLGIGQQCKYPWWSAHDPRFDLQQTPNEANRYGWVVEIDPYNPKSTPVKRTSLGRFKHETATVVLSKNQHVVVYSGDDQQFEYLYKFISKDPYIPGRSTDHLLDTGTLYVAKFAENNTMTWLPLVFGNTPLTPDNAFHSQADVLIETRRAADLLRATTLDRPEGISIHPHTGDVYVSLTNNSLRTAAQVDDVNPKANNTTGQILRLQPGEDDHASLAGKWDLFLLGGRNHNEASGEWLACPDNLLFTEQGQLLIGTDGMGDVADINDGLYMADATGAVKQLYRCPLGAELTGMSQTPDQRTLFISVQHPGNGSTWGNPSTRWPDFKDGTPPRCSVVAITRTNGGRIGG